MVSSTFICYCRAELHMPLTDWFRPETSKQAEIHPQCHPARLLEEWRPLGRGAVSPKHGHPGQRWAGPLPPATPNKKSRTNPSTHMESMRSAITLTETNQRTRAGPDIDSRPARVIFGRTRVPAPGRPGAPGATVSHSQSGRMSKMSGRIDTGSGA